MVVDRNEDEDEDEEDGDLQLLQTQEDVSRMPRMHVVRCTENQRTTT